VGDGGCGGGVGWDWREIDGDRVCTGTLDLALCMGNSWNFGQDGDVCLSHFILSMYSILEACLPIRCTNRNVWTQKGVMDGKDGWVQ